MEYEENNYVLKRHPQTQRLLRQIMTSTISLLVVTLLTLGTLWLSTRQNPQPVILGSQTSNQP